MFPMQQICIQQRWAELFSVCALSLFQLLALDTSSCPFPSLLQACTQQLLAQAKVTQKGALAFGSFYKACLKQGAPPAYQNFT